MDLKLCLKILFILKILIFVNHVCLGLDVLSKFHQTDYNIRNTRVEVTDVNKEYINVFHAIGYKHNRTTTAFNVTFSPKFNLENKAEVLVQGYKRASNEYRLFPKRFQVNVCRAIATNALGLRKLENYGNLTSCFWKKDILYYMTGFLLDEYHLPPFMPTGEYKDYMEVTHQNNKLFAFNFYMEVYRPEV